MLYHLILDKQVSIMDLTDDQHCMFILVQTSQIKMEFGSVLHLKIIIFNCLFLVLGLFIGWICVCLFCCECVDDFKMIF